MSTSRYFLLYLWAASLVSSHAVGSAQTGPTVRIENGLVLGTTTSVPAASATVNQFLGIPFAQSPPERFSPPRAASQVGVINATAWKPACIQQFTYPVSSQQFTESVFNSPAPVESEDCLYLNIYAPATQPNDRNGRAVLFWLYGGGLEFGNAGQPAYDGSQFAGYEDVIVVTTNYRTNVFGFPSSPELPLTGHNLGFLDQRFALDWVQRNIHAFGGDPSKVTIFGESAGAFSVDALLTSYPKDSNPPFRGAIMESGQASYIGSPTTSSVPAWYNLTGELGCPGNFASNLSCVKAANVTDIKRIIEVYSLEFNPSPDNVTLVSDPAQRRALGQIAKVPIMGGANAQEGRVFQVGQNNITEFLNSYFSSSPALILAIEEAYPLGKNGLNTPYDVISQIWTDYIFQCPQALLTNASAASGIPTWRYYFNASFTNTQRYPDLGVYHSSEIPIVFSTYPLFNVTTQEYALSRFMRGAWATFAKNPATGPGWNAVGTGIVGAVYSTPFDGLLGGVLTSSNETVLQGQWNLGVLGDVGEVKGSGVTVLPQSIADGRCALFAPVYEALLQGS
ncbi:alpha/beta-hydrolase [Aureobasidium pullulans]|uniref:Carboxylic ester hydrolase n=1 Tax=Aureobasidium pullulans TaxID=5580 RepID=A0A4S9YC59_AURPU|nr:alpha/beta-hydrolase [Aureobasidium pullulans]